MVIGTHLPQPGHLPWERALTSPLQTAKQYQTIEVRRTTPIDDMRGNPTEKQMGKTTVSEKNLSGHEHTFENKTLTSDTFFLLILDYRSACPDVKFLFLFAW